MKKRILSVLLTFALVLSIAGCNSSTETTESTTSEETKATTTAAVTEEITTTTEAPKEVKKITE